ncbi:MAG: hypothetical protein HFG44_00045 [Oscillospiraceae bacterium]|nr:hypothetical protein [Oscillospiraceae bacterium]
MGSWFSNLHVQKTAAVTMEQVMAYIGAWMQQQKYTVAASEEEADGVFAVCTSEASGWYSVYSDLFCFEDPNAFSRIAKPMSAALQTQVLGMSCFDSDYLYLNLVHASEAVDAWAGIGSAAGLGLKRRTGLAAWKDHVEDFQRFKECVRKKYVLAEEALAELEPCLKLPQVHGIASYEYLKELDLQETATFLYLKLPEELKNQEPPKFVPHIFSLYPSFIGDPQVNSFLNVGGAAKGLHVFFLGPYVEHDEITFSETAILRHRKDGKIDRIPFELQKVKLVDGQLAYHYYDPGARIPAKVDDRLSPMKLFREQEKNSICIRFVPQGNPRKILDITMALVPGENFAGQCGWNVWRSFGSKAAYLADYNETWRKICAAEGRSFEELKEEDFD